jgi:hypothetical protein
LDPATKKNLLPTENIAVAGQFSLLLQTPTRIDSVIVGPIDGLGSARWASLRRPEMARPGHRKGQGGDF